MSLAELQALFWRAVREAAPPEGLDAVFVSRAGMGATRRMEIYHSAYWARHEQCLKETYPRVWHALGDAGFRRLTASYIAERPSVSPCIEWAGEALPSHLRTHGAALSLPSWLADLAQLEWARIVAWTAPDEPSRISAASLADAQSVTRRMRMAPCLSVLHVQRQAFADFCEGGLCTVPAQPTEPTQPVAERQQTWVALWRSHKRVHTLALEDDHGRALDQARSGATLALACEELDELAEPERTLERAIAMVAQWISRGWLIGWEDEHGET